jgi:hypothetical protein
MGEGAHEDVTDNDYRNTLEVRGRDYQGVHGTVSYRMITGTTENHVDANQPRSEPEWTRSEWYFFKMWWKTNNDNQAGYEIRRGSPNGPLHDEGRVRTDGHPYRPSPWYIYLGSPPARGGPGNATHAGMTVRDVWVSDRTRPDFGFPSPATGSPLNLITKPGTK